MAKGFSQIEGPDYDQIFSPVVCFETVCLMLALAALEDWHISGVDVKNAYLYVKLDVEFPDHIDPKSIPLLEQALPPRAPVEMFDKKVILEEVTLDDAAETRSRGAYGRGGDDMMDEDDEQPRVQCANQ